MDTKGFQIGDKVIRGKGKKVFTIAGFKTWEDSAFPKKVSVLLSTGTYYPLDRIHRAASA